jgi:putative sugar O-methyltransferase
MNHFHRKVINKIIREFKLSIDILRISREFRNDKNYDLSSVEKGFADRNEKMSEDSDLLNRICIAYNKSKKIQRHVSPVYSPSNEWLPIYERPLKEVIDALTKGDLNKLGHIYSNFWRDPCSTGLTGLQIDMQKNFFKGKISLRHKMLWLNDALYRLRLWNRLLGNTHTIEDLDSPNIGNPYGYYYNGSFIKVGSDYQHYYATMIGGMIKENKSKVVVELGSGFGGMPYYLLRDNKNITYIDLDLPENAALTAYYLIKAMPKKKIRLFGETDLTQESILSNEILIMPSFVIETLPSDFAGVVFNSYSLAEMSVETINTYINEFTRIICDTGYFQHVNHNKNSLIIADDFGINPEKFSLLYKTPALWNMGRNTQMDEYEYLYRKEGINKEET